MAPNLEARVAKRVDLPRGAWRHVELILDPPMPQCRLVYHINKRGGGLHVDISAVRVLTRGFCCLRRIGQCEGKNETSRSIGEPTINRNGLCYG